MVTSNDVKPIAVARLRLLPAGEHGEFDMRGKPLRTFPPWQRVPLVAAHDPEQAGGRKFFRHGFGR